MPIFSKKEIDSDVLLEKAVSEALTDASPTTVRIVAAVAGLLAAVAYADRNITAAEDAHMNIATDSSNSAPAQADSASRMNRPDHPSPPRSTRAWPCSE